MKTQPTLKTLNDSIKKLTDEKLRQYYLRAGSQSVLIDDMPDDVLESVVRKLEQEAKADIVSQLSDDTLFAIRSIQPALSKIKAGTKFFFNLQLFRDWGLIKERVDVDGWSVYYLSDFGELIVSLNLNL